MSLLILQRSESTWLVSCCVLILFVLFVVLSPVRPSPFFSVISSHGETKRLARVGWADENGTSTRNGGRIISPVKLPASSGSATVQSLFEMSKWGLKLFPRCLDTTDQWGRKDSLVGLQYHKRPHGDITSRAHGFLNFCCLDLFSVAPDPELHCAFVLHFNKVNKVLSHTFLSPTLSLWCFLLHTFQ